MAISSNPYTIGFGKIPAHYISRDLVIEEILDEINSETIREQAFKLTGIRGTGKTVTLTAIENALRDDKKWIVTGIRPEGNITEEVVGSKIIEELNKKGKRLLITIDEVKNTSEMRSFIQEFQILIRQDLPVFLIIAGLYDDVENLENADHLTFFLRAEKYEMKPLNHTIMRSDYVKTLGVSTDTAEQMASITKGYAFAYQALGKYMWDFREKNITEEVLAKLDEALSEKVYQKIWSELTPKERWFLGYIVKKEKMPVRELLELTHQNKSQFSRPRDGLRKKGVIDTSVRGEISIRLPRFKEFVEYQMSL